MRVIDREMLPSVIFDLAQRVQQLGWIGVVADARLGMDILQWQNLCRALILAGDDAARFVRRVAARLRDELGELVTGQFHFRFSIADFRLAAADLREAAMIATNSSASFNNELTKCDFISPPPTMSSIQEPLSSASSSTTPILAMNSAFERLWHAAR